MDLNETLNTPEVKERLTETITINLEEKMAKPIRIRRKAYEMPSKKENIIIAKGVLDMNEQGDIFFNPNKTLTYDKGEEKKLFKELINDEL